MSPFTIRVARLLTLSKHARTSPFVNAGTRLGHNTLDLMRSHISVVHNPKIMFVNLLKLSLYHSQLMLLRRHLGHWAFFADCMHCSDGMALNLW